MSAPSTGSATSAPRLLRPLFHQMVGHVAVFGLSLGCFSVIARALGPGDLGRSGVLVLLSSLLAGLGTLGTDTALTWIFHQPRHAGHRDSLVRTSWLITMAQSLLLTAAGLLVAPWLASWILGPDGAALPLVLVLLGRAVDSARAPLIAVLALTGRSAAVSWLSAGAEGLGMILALSLAAVDRLGLEGLFAARLLASLLVTSITIAIVRPGSRGRFSPALARELLALGWPVALRSGALAIVDWADRALVLAGMGAARAGVYGAGYTLGASIRPAVEAWGAAWRPHIAAFAGRPREAAAEIARWSRHYLLISVPIAIVAFASARSVAALLFPGGFEEAHAVVGLIVVAYLLKGAYVMAISELALQGCMRTLLALEALAGFLHLVAVAILVPVGSLAATAAATPATYALMALAARVLTARALTRPAASAGDGPATSPRRAGEAGGIPSPSGWAR